MAYMERLMNTSLAPTPQPRVKEGTFEYAPDPNGCTFRERRDGRKKIKAKNTKLDTFSISNNST